MILLILIISIIHTSEANYTTTTCEKICGTRHGEYHNPVPFPFGFSDGCGIRLNCSETGDVKLGEFTVQNVTRDSILINLPANCSRPVTDLRQMVGENYGLTSRNGLLLQNCSAPLKDCVIPTSMVENRFELWGCESDQASGNQSNSNHSISCYSEDEGGGDGFMNYSKVLGAKCGILFSSIAVNLDGNGTSPGLMEFQTVELGWWLNGACRCAKDAYCDNVTIGGGRFGYRCNCREGFEGDGFVDGNGCQRVSSCNAPKFISGNCGGNTRVGVLIGGIIAGACLMSTVALICYCIRRQATFRNQMKHQRILSEAAGSFSVPFYPYREIEKATNAFSEKQRLGTGAYGTVYAGKLNNDEWVAIKKIKNRDTDGIEQVMNEIKLLSSVSHPNLVRLLGCCIEKDEKVLVYEFMPNGTLSQHLQRERGNGLPWTIRLTIATETAHAIAHLHSAMNPPIYHRDIKSSNILLDYSFNSKVADFGLSRLGMPDDSHISTAPQGTPGYLDPQYHQNFHLSDKSDVYSFGVVLVEIITGLKVVDFSRPHTEINLASLAIERIGKGLVDEIIDPSLEPNGDAWTLSSIHKVAELAFRCLAFHRDMRPSMIEVADELEQIRLSGWAPREETVEVTSSVASTCSSQYHGSERSVESGSRRLIVPHRAADCVTKVQEMKDMSPVSVHHTWLSDRSSPSTNSLLGNVR